MKIIVFLLLFVLTGCATLPQKPVEIQAMPTQVSLPDKGLAPELTNETWINTATPLRLSDLHGKVVLLEMWTFECINCRHTIPQLNTWYNAYGKQGLVIIGNHYPEFPYEANLDNLKQAVIDLGIQYPVAQDNDGITWRAYKNQYWPTIYLIDKTGHIRYVQIGEGAYATTEAAIKSLLSEAYQ